MFLRQVIRVPKNVRRNTTSTISSTAETTSDGKKTFYEKINIVKHIREMSTTKKIVFGTWFVLGSGYYISATYHDGREELANLRRYSKTPPTYDEELHAVRRGCAKNSYDNFWRGVIIPYTFFNDTIPYLVLKCNSEN